MKVRERMGAGVSRKVNVNRGVWERRGDYGESEDEGLGVSDRVVTTCAVMGEYSAL